MYTHGTSTGKRLRTLAICRLEISLTKLPLVHFSQSVFINEDIYRINKLTTTDKALYSFYVADKSVPPIYLRELS